MFLGLAGTLPAVDLQATLEVGARSAQGTPLTYAWTTEERPLGAGLPVFTRVDPALGGATDARIVTLVDAQAGLYRFAVRIRDGETAVSETVEVLVQPRGSAGGGVGTGTPPPTASAEGGAGGGGCGLGSGVGLVAFLGWMLVGRRNPRMRSHP